MPVSSRLRHCLVGTLEEGGGFMKLTRKVQGNSEFWKSPLVTEMMNSCWREESL